ncbi:hypothetical protein H0H92_004938 [Tricholoma furcatifolium]|nr:hypothetical protein H0H92_004938 [Tricholoma furcatifolium]
MADTSLDSQHFNLLRRTRSASDIPRQPEAVYRPGLPQSPTDGGIINNTVEIPNRPRRSMDNEAVAPIPLTFPQTQTLGRYPSPRARNLTVDDASSVHDAPQRPWYKTLMLNLGFGRGASRERRSLVGLILNVASGASQIVIITVILVLSGTRFKSPTDPTLTEWAACARPLGPWACLWAIRAVLATTLNYWGFLRERQLLARRRSNENDLGNSTAEARRNSGAVHTGNESARNNTARAMDNQEFTSREAATLPYTLLYSRLTFFSSLLTLSWFLTAHILTYTSINTCRETSPHIWWLIFGILCLMYLMVLEVLVLSFIVFVVAPILFLFWNVILICMGRHPLQTQNALKPSVGKLPKSVVERIPLVLYIPPPPDTFSQPIFSVTSPSITSSKPVGHQTPLPKVSSGQQGFQFLRSLTSLHCSKNNKSPSRTGDNDLEKGKEPETWEEHWEKGDYPFVVLEENRAACAICLVDFAEPKRLYGLSNNSGSKADGVSSLNTFEPNSNAPKADTAVSRSDANDAEIKLADTGEGTQPLRLLDCGHVFHKSCLDPWLLDISGRCPVCQREVEIPGDKKAKKR